MNDYDGCSALAPLPRRIRVPLQRAMVRRVFTDPKAAESACLQHDAAYERGGNRQDRRDADAMLLMLWIVSGRPRRGWRWFPIVGYLMIRAFGGPWTRREGVSWAFGADPAFRYDG